MQKGSAQYSQPRSGRLLAAALILVFTGIAASQDNSVPQVSPTPRPFESAQDSNPAKLVFFQVRSEYTSLRVGNWNEVVIIRSDKGFLRKSRGAGKIGVITRFDIPIVIQRFGTTKRLGLGDLYVQALEFPKLNRKGGFAIGSGLSIPTATQKTTGTGKWMIAPLVGPLLIFNHGDMAFIKVQQFISFAGPSSRASQSFLLVTPIVKFNIRQKSWLLFTAESRTSFKPIHGTWYKAGIQFGHVFSKKLAFWVEPDIIWGATRPGNFSLKFSFLRNR